MSPVFSQENFWLPPNFSEEGEVTLGVGGQEAGHAYLSGRVKNEVFYLLMITHIAGQYPSGVEGLSVSCMSSKVTCLDFGCHLCCS